MKVEVRKTAQFPRGVIDLSGLEGGETICLIDPTLDEPQLPGEKAAEPEINKGRQPRPGMRPSGSRPGK